MPASTALLFRSPIKLSLLLVSTLLLTACDTALPDTRSAQFEKLTNEQQILACDAAQQSTRQSTPFVEFSQTSSRPSTSGISPLLADIHTREASSLNGQWQYLIDQLDMGDKGLTMQGGIGLGEEASATQLIEYGFSDRSRLTVPGDWNSQVPELQWYRGVIWYKKTFNFENKKNAKQFLYFDGAYLKKDIYLNGELIARHDGGFTAFNVELSDKIKNGKNTLIIKVDSRSTPEGIPTEYNDWMNYGGLTRDISIVTVPKQHIQNYKLNLDNQSGKNIQGWVKVSGEEKEVNIRIPQAQISHAIKVNELGYASFSFPADLTLWSPNNPFRYSVEIQYANDTINSKVGFRTIKTEGNKMLLNGQSIFLRGISMHEESMLKLGRANTKEDADTTITYLKDLNANFVRLAHYQHNRYMIEAAEAAGILIWSELPIYHSMAYDNPCTLLSAKRQFSEMIDRDQNRAAIILWSISNEAPVNDARNVFLAELAKHVRQQDSSRLITSALFGRKDEMKLVAENVGKIVLKENGRNGSLVGLLPSPDPVTIVLDDPLGDIVDVLGYNEYLGWYVSAVAVRVMAESDWDVTEEEFRSAMLKEMKNVIIKSNFNKPIILSEFGAGAKQGFHATKKDIWSEQLQQAVYQSQFELMKNMPDLVGMSPWVLKDFRSPYRLNDAFQDYWNRKGLVSETGKKKAAFYDLAAHYKSMKATLGVD